jgi:hypothetical protein
MKMKKKLKTKRNRRPPKAGKDGPFPMWTRLSVRGRFGKDGPFPLSGASLYWEKVPFDTLYQGNNGPKNLKTGVVRSASELASHLPGFNFPDVDFGKEEVIFVGLGARLGNVRMVGIDEVRYFTDRGPKFDGPLTIAYYGEFRTKGREDGETYPLHVIKLRKLEGSEAEFSQH